MGNKIKILYTIPNFKTAGSGKVVYDLVKGLDKNLLQKYVVLIQKEIFLRRFKN